MQNAIPFELTLEVLTPFSMEHPTPLDALLAAAIFRKTGLVGQACVPHIPLVHENGIFKASSLVLPRHYRVMRTARIMKITDEVGSEFHSFNKRKKEYGPLSKQFQNVLDYRQSINAKEVSFFAVGDPEATVKLIQDFIPGIGKRSSSGSGEIGRVFWNESEDFSWQLADGTPARPLPVDVWKAINGDPDAPTMNLAVQLPYWESPKVEAVFPYSP